MAQPASRGLIRSTIQHGGPALATRTGGSESGPIEAVVFDVGETLVNETELWGEWADWLGVPRLAFFGALGAVIALGSDYRAVFELVRPGIDLRAEETARREAGRRRTVDRRDLYPDAVPCLEALLDAGFRVGIAANQPATTEVVIHELNLPLDLVATSERWGLAKPDPAFFERIASELGLPPERIVYVGDRLDNDIGPAAAAGMVPVFMRRGPWGVIQSGRTDPLELGAVAVIDSLSELPALLNAMGERR